MFIRQISKAIPYINSKLKVWKMMYWLIITKRKLRKRYEYYTKENLRQLFIGIEKSLLNSLSLFYVRVRVL